MVRKYKLMKLKGQFAENQRKATDNEPNIGLTDIVTSSHIRALADSLRAVERYWLADSSGLPPVMSAHHTRIIPKSLRVHEILKKSSTSIIGARYSRTDPICHIFTYLCSLSVIRNGIERLDQLAAIIDESPFSGTITGRQVKAMAAVRDIRSDDPRAAEKKRRQAAKLAKLGISEKQGSDGVSGHHPVRHRQEPGGAAGLLWPAIHPNQHLWTNGMACDAETIRSNRSEGALPHIHVDD